MLCISSREKGYVGFGSEAAQSTEATGLAMSGLLPKLT
jgi:hypothetical protein